MGEPTDKIPYYLVEVTVAGAIIDADGKIVGDNMTDATLQFGWRADDVPVADVSDEQVNEALRRLLSMVIPVVQVGMTANKWAYFGQAEEPMVERRARVTGHARSDGFTLRIPMPDVQGRA